VSTGLDLQVLTDLTRRMGELERGAAPSGVEDLLEEASRQLTELLASAGCAISRLSGNKLRECGAFSPPPLRVYDGHDYLVDDYPTTRRVLLTRIPAIAARDDSESDPREAFVLEHVGAASVLMLPLVVDGRSWGLIEVYRVDPRSFNGVDVALAELFAVQLGHLVHGIEMAGRVSALYRETLASLANALELKDASTHAHAEEVVELTLSVGRRLGVPGDELRDLELGALLHDIGKIRLPDSILNKPGPLTPAEWELVHEHPAAGEALLKPIASLTGALPIVRSHHERWDGSGYPDGLAGDAIPLGARIVAVCDAYCAMSERRPYQEEQDEAAIIAELRDNAGSQFDPHCVAALVETVKHALIMTATPLRRPAPDLTDAMRAA
jgi:HD-GYP domain-containing protein (c-di-GMP phosphodiesterase class II)